MGALPHKGSSASTDHAVFKTAPCVVTLLYVHGVRLQMVKEHEATEAIHERAKKIVALECSHPHTHKYPKAMHILEYAHNGKSPPPVWEGITGRVKYLLKDALAVAQIANEENFAALRASDAAREERMLGETRAELGETQKAVRQVRMPQGRRACFNIKTQH